MRSIGTDPDLDFQNLNPDFPIERKIRKRISLPRNPSSGWISIKKSKSGVHRFPFYRSIGKSEKGFAKVFSWTVVFFLLSMRARGRPLFLRTVFQILFRIPNRMVKTDIRILKSKSRFPNRTHPKIPLKWAIIPFFIRSKARNFTTNVSKILDLKSSSEQMFSKNWCWVPLFKT